MNNARRDALAKIGGDLEQVILDIEDLKTEEEDYLNNMPDSFRDGAKGEATQEAIDQMDNAIASAREAIDQLDAASE